MSEPEPLSDLLKRIDALAKDATPGKWPLDPEGETFMEDVGDAAHHFIAALDPQTWLRVSAALREALAERDRFKSGLMGAAMFAKPPGERERALKAEVARLKGKTGSCDQCEALARLRAGECPAHGVVTSWGPLPRGFVPTTYQCGCPIPAAARCPT